ncbi:MAG TPA: L-histidine N(alpha)-methyltransferase [Acidimicrobiales bacterium]|nr:L-histidine N(alpha)-methyltransferase [Acidimicrobiales bacterium]
MSEAESIFATSAGKAVTATVHVEVLLGADDLDDALRRDVRRGLTSSPKEIPPKYLYDDEGSRLFDEITRLPEYYPTRREREILDREALAIADLSKADTLVELGSGTSEKTRLLLDALRDRCTLRRFVPFDVSEATLVRAGEAVAREYPGVAVHAVVGDFERHLTELPTGGRRMIAFLGGTIGNLHTEARASFFSTIASGLRPEDSFLLGTDLVKDVARLEAAYDDAAGMTAAFNKNVLAVINRRLGGHFDLDAFDHLARFDVEHEWIEMLLRSRRAQRVAIDDLGLDVGFDDGEVLRTEISAKFRRDGISSELAGAGLEICGWWTDSAGDFALSLSRLA